MLQIYFLLSSLNLFKRYKTKYDINNIHCFKGNRTFINIYNNNSTKEGGKNGCILEVCILLQLSY